MAYRFKLDEPIQSGVRRIGAEQIDRAISELVSNAGSVTAVHEARKSLKRVRALLRLVRPAIGEAAFERENVFFRETSALLSHVRDREILLETAVKLESRFSEPPDAAVGRLRMALSAEVETETGVDDKANARAEAATRLRKARTRFMRLKLEPDGFEALSDGLEQSFRRAAKAFEHACEEPTNDSVHEWRKGVQQHWRHMLLLRRAWPELADARMHSARKLSQILGDDHDLAILQIHLGTERPKTLTSRDLHSVVRLASQRQSELRALARPLGRKLFSDSPRSLGRRFAVYWSAALELREFRTSSESNEQPDS